MKNNKKAIAPRSYGKILIDTLCCVFISAGVTVAVYPQISAGFPIFNLIAACVATLAVLGLLSVRRKLILWGSVAVFAAIAVYVFLPGNLQHIISYFDAFTSFITSANFLNYAGKDRFGTAQIVICILISVVIFLLVRLLHSVYPAVIAAAVMIILSTVYGIEKNNVIAVILVMIGSLPVTAANFYSKNRTFRALVLHKKPQKLTADWKVQSWAALVIVLAVIVSVFSLPKNTMSLRKRFATNAVADAQTSTNSYTVKQEAVKPKDLHNIGLQPGKKIGGNLKFNNNDIVAIITSNEQLFLKTAVLDIYNGEKWTSSFERAYRIGGSLFKDKQSEVLNNCISSDTNFTEIFNTLYPEKHVSVILGTPSNYIPVPGFITSFSEETPTVEPILFNMLSEIFAFTALPEGYSYNVAYRDTMNDYSNFNTLEIYKKLPKDKNLANDAFVARYTALPKNFSKSAASCALTVTAGLKDDYARITALNKYLSESGNFTYTELPGKMPENSDVSTELLKTGKGSSIYYATCLAEMARSISIPARLVGGYYARTYSNTYNAYIATEKDAFAWVECYVANVGWMQFNPSPLSPEGMDDGNDDKDIKIPEESEPNPTLSDSPKEDGSQKDKVSLSGGFRTFSLWSVIFAIILLAVIILITNAVRSSRYYTEDYIRRNFIEKADGAEYCFADIKRQLKCVGIKFTGAETLIEQGAAASGLRRGKLIAETFSIMNDFRYSGNKQLPENYLQKLCDTHEAIEQMLMDKMNPFKYFFIRKALLIGKTGNKLLKKR